MKIVKPYGTNYSVMVGDKEVAGNISTFDRAKKIAKIRSVEGSATEILKVVAVVSRQHK
jgi:3,4-dihydroxy-2-butanone 4-phosphate synthase